MTVSDANPYYKLQNFIIKPTFFVNTEIQNSNLNLTKIERMFCCVADYSLNSELAKCGNLAIVVGKLLDCGKLKGINHSNKLSISWKTQHEKVERE